MFRGVAATLECVEGFEDKVSSRPTSKASTPSNSNNMGL
jgi:hypothetical protein